MKKIFCIIFCVIFAVSLFYGCKNFRENETAGQPNYNVDVNGELVPMFSDVSPSFLDPALFEADENGRMTYKDDGVYTCTGIDVSVFQGEIDWDAVKADGIDFVMLRAGYRGYGSKGIMGEDENFARNADAAHKAGLRVGAYFFSQATSAQEAREEALFLLDIIKDRPIDYPVAYDWEIIDYDAARTDNMTAEEITACAAAFCETVAAAGYEPLIYFNCELGYFNYDLTRLKDFHFWLAEYGSAPAFYYDYKIWQYTTAGSVAGISENVDMNICVWDFSGNNSVG